MPTSLSWRQRGRLSTRPGGGMLLKTGGGKFLKNSAATGGMIQKNDRPPLTAFYSYAGHVLTKAEIDLARRVYRALARLPRGGSLHQVHGLLWRALITES